MSATAVRPEPAALEAAMLDVQSTLAELLLAADEQYAAVVARDHERLEAVTRQQERLAARLARAEARRMEVLGGVPLTDAVATAEADDFGHLEGLCQSVAAAVRELKRRQAQNASLLEQSIELTGQTLSFLHRLVTTPSPAYGARGYAVQSPSVLVDSRA